MKKQQFHIKAHFTLILLIAFLLPIAKLTPVFIVLLLLNWLVEGDFKNKFALLFSKKTALLFIGLYLLHVAGLAYTQNMASGSFDLEVKLSILVFPLILASRPIERSAINRVMLAFTLGCCLSLLIMLGRAIGIYASTGENNFYYQALSFLIHPSYISMYLNLCLAWIFYHYVKGNLRQTGMKPILAITIVLFFIFMMILLSSKMGFLTLLFLVAGFLIYFIVARKKYLFGIVGVVLIVSSILGMWNFVPEFRGRMGTAIEALTASNTNQAEGESTAVRMLIWKAANTVIADNLLIGAGTGDAKDELMKEYEKRGMTSAIEHKLNAHNEFYQVFVSLGLIGFVLFLANLFLPLFNAWKKKEALYVLFLLMLLLNFAAESMLETQAGVVYYAFFNALLCFAVNGKREFRSNGKAS